mgnify:CR=1 FL=1
MPRALLPKKSLLDLIKAGLTQKKMSVWVPVVYLGKTIKGRGRARMTYLVPCTEGMAIEVFAKKATIAVLAAQDKMAELNAVGIDEADLIKCATEEEARAIALLMAKNRGGTPEPVFVELPLSRSLHHV